MTRIRKRRYFALLWETQQGKCAYCRCQMDTPTYDGITLIVAPTTPTFDHIHPRSAGGADSEENLLLACHECNLAKGSDYKDRRTGPSPEEVVQPHDQQTRITIKSHLYELERHFKSAVAKGLPKEKKTAIWTVYKFWEHQLFTQNLSGKIISDIQQSGMFLRDRTIAQCWVPLYDVDTYHQAPKTTPHKRRCKKRHKRHAGRR